ncbi:ammonia-forming cytochrome c nitrite reductase subunit c552 [bacterium]|nr:ammonia-forming cytochrome c nitrite reductase subunit c552 [bacterium]
MAQTLKRPQMIVWLIVGAGLCLGCLMICLRERPSSQADATVQTPLDEIRPREVAADGFVGSGKCRSCHSREHETWHASFHRTMTQRVEPENLKVNLDNLQISVAGRRFRFHRDGDTYLVDLPKSRSSAETESRRLVLMTGSHHMHIFWHEANRVRLPQTVSVSNSGGDAGPDRMLQMLPIVYDITRQRWIPRHSAFLRDDFVPNDAEGGRWNDICLRCHTTHPRSRWDEPSDNYDTQVAEFGISCEACHGPGSQHVTTIQTRPEMPLNPVAIAETGNQTADWQIVNPAKLDHRRSAQICGQCHSHFLLRREDLDLLNASGFPFRPGERFADRSIRHLVRVAGESADPAINEFQPTGTDFPQAYFWSDGMIRISGREFNGLVESPCFQRGTMSCLSCHRLHRSADDARTLADWASDQLDIGMAGNHACLQCHQQFKENVTSHTHHAVESSGSDCMNCHMPYTTYGLLKAIRSHQISSPQVTATLQTGRPLACNQCHLDRTLQWSAGHLADWFGHELPELSPERKKIADSVLQALAGDAGQRALAAWSFGWPVAQATSGTDWMVPSLLTLMGDPYDAVRQIAERSLSTLPSQPERSYEFTATAETRTRELSRLLELWENADPVRTPNPAVLIGPAGGLQGGVVNELLQARDHRPVRLLE